MNDFERELAASLRGHAERIQVPAEMGHRVVRRARTRRTVTAGIAGVAVVAIVATGIAGATRFLADPETPPAGEGRPTAAAPAIGEILSERECDVVDDPNLPDGARCVSLVRADADGDGEVDDVFVYTMADDAPTFETVYRARAVLATGATLDDPIQTEEAPAVPMVAAGAADMDRDGDAEIIVAVNGGGTAIPYGFLTISGESLVRVVDRNEPHGEILKAIPIAGSAGHANGAYCDDVLDDPRPELIQTTAVPSPGDAGQWIVEESVFRWVDHATVELVERQSLETSVPVEEINSNPPAYRQFRCGGLVLPAPSY